MNKEQYYHDNIIPSLGTKIYTVNNVSIYDSTIQSFSLYNQLLKSVNMEYKFKYPIFVKGGESIDIYEFKGEYYAYKSK